MEYFPLTQRAKSNITRTALGLIMVTSVFLRMPHFMDSLWRDEVWYSTRMFMKDVPSLLYNIFNDKSAPLYYVCMFLWTKIFGDSEISIRIPPLLSGILSLYLTYLLAIKATCRKTALLACFLLCISPAHIWYSVDATPYSLCLCFFLLTLFSFYKVRERPSSREWYAIYFIAFISTIFIHWFAAVYVLVISFISLSEVDTVKKNILIRNAVILFILSIFIFLKMYLGHINQSTYFLRPFTLLESWLFFFNWLIFGHSLWLKGLQDNAWRTLLHHPRILPLQILVLFILIRGIVAIFRVPEYRYGRDILWYAFFLPLSILALSYLGWKEIYIERYLYIVSPFFFILLAQGIIGLKRKRIRICAFIILIIICFSALIDFFKNYNKQTVAPLKADFRSVAAYFISHMRYSRQPFVIFTKGTKGTFYETPLLYYVSYVNRKVFSPTIIWYKESLLFCNILHRHKIQTFYLLPSKGKEFYESELKGRNCSVYLIDRRTFRGGIELLKFGVQSINAGK